MNDTHITPTCLHCDEDLTPAEQVRVGQQDGYCDSCEENANERAHETMLAGFYGSSAPQTDKERMDEAYRQRERERRVSADVSLYDLDARTRVAFADALKEAEYSALTLLSFDGIGADHSQRMRYEGVIRQAIQCVRASGHEPVTQFYRTEATRLYVALAESVAVQVQARDAVIRQQQTEIDQLKATLAIVDRRQPWPQIDEPSVAETAVA